MNTASSALSLHTDVPETHPFVRRVHEATSALDAPRLSPPQRLALLERRVNARVALGELPPAEADARAMLAIAQRTKRAAHEAQALCALALVQSRQERFAQALESAGAAEAAAKRVRSAAEREPLLALALLRLATTPGADPAQALLHLEQAAQRFAALGDDAQHGKALRLLATKRMLEADTPEHRALAEQALALARAGEDRGEESRALQTLHGGDPDLALRLRGQNLALRMALQSGERSLERLALFALATTYSRLGLHRRALRLVRQSVATGERHAPTSALLNAYSLLAFLHSALNQREAFDTLMQAFTALAAEVKAEDGGARAAALAAWSGARADRWLAPREAVALWLRAGQLTQKLDAVAAAWAAPLQLSMLARARLRAGQARAALRDSSAAVEALRSFKGRWGGAVESPAHTWWQHARALRANGRAAEAAAALEAAHESLTQSLAAISDEGLRRTALHAPVSHAELLDAWLAHARAAGLPRERITAHLTGRASLQDSVERLVDTGLRLNEQTTSAALLDFLVEEVAELLGARRVLLVLETVDGPAIAGTQVPESEMADTLLQAITPWLDEARRTRQTALRHGPDGADAIDQRGCLVAPLMAQGHLLGFVYADLEGLFGRLHEGDRDLLATLAAQAAVALANLRTQEGLERQVAERTADLTMAKGQAEQRAAELALINRIQQGIAARLDFRGIVEAVGDALQDIFGSKDLWISWWDHQADTLEQLYAIEHGIRLPQRPARPTPYHHKPLRPLLHQGVGIRLGTRAEQQAAGIPGPQPGTDWCHSTMAAPMRGSQRVLGLLAVENHEREHAYGEAELRLLTTIGATLGTALENARLFDETQRLLKETEARNAELAVINSVQQGMAGSLDFRGIVELVGEKLRSVFGVGNLGINVWDEDAQELVALYAVEHGVRLPVTRFRAEPGTYVHQTIVAQKVFVFGSVEEQLRGGVPVSDGTDRARSILGAPMLAGERMLGFVVIENHERDNAFGDADVRLLTTVASSMAMALDNVRLFDETQAALQRQTASADILRAISQSPTDVMPVVDVIVSTARRLLNCFRTALLRCDGAELVAMRRATADGIAGFDWDRFPLDPQRNFPSRALMLPCAAAPLRLGSTGAE
jgi:GAF domain-containing protein